MKFFFFFFFFLREKPDDPRDGGSSRVERSEGRTFDEGYFYFSFLQIKGKRLCQSEEV
jgi:hypothetical protein